MKRNYLMLLVLMLFFCSCEELQKTARDRQPINEEYLKRAGILGEHELKHPEKTDGFSGSLSGSFFILSGSIDGKISSSSKLMFSWCPVPNEVVPSEFSRSMFREIIDDTKSNPTIEFVFRKDWLKTQSYWEYREVMTSRNVNTIINSAGDNLDVILIRISKESLKKEPALPQL